MKTAVITGSAKGLGRAVALALSNEGYTLALHFNKSRKEAEDLLLAVQKKSPKSFLVSGDLKSEKSVQDVFEDIFSKLGKVDLLVNNVGNFLYKKFSKTTSSEFKDVLESNIYSTLFCSRAVLPKMRKQKSGHIVNIGSVGTGSILALPNSTPYYIAKNALLSLTKIMAWEEARNGIHVNMISPASLKTDIFEKKDFPMGRSAKYEDVTSALLFLISPDGYYINGSNIEVAGGFIPGLS